MNKNKMAPPIRFQGFIAPWKQRKLSEVTDRYDNLRVPVTANLRIPGNTPYYGANGIQDYVDGYTHDGEFILVAEDGAKDLSNYPINYVNGRIWVNNHAHVLQGKNHIASNKFLAYAMRKIDIKSVLVGGGRAKLNAEAMMKLGLQLPSYSEQAKIGASLQTIDNLITLHQRKLEQQKKMRAYFLKYMFPDEGEKIPKIRFQGFTENWKQHKLRDLGKIVTGSTPSTSNPKYYSVDGIPWVTPTDIQSNLILDTERHLSEEGIKVARIVPANTILCTCIASIGKNALLPIKGSFNQQINSLTPNRDNDVYFLLAESNLWSRKMKHMAASGTMQIVNKKEFSELATMIPEYNEQKKIGLWFKKVDDLINLQQRKIDQLQTVKKFMLQNMFI